MLLINDCRCKKQRKNNFADCKLTAMTEMIVNKFLLKLFNHHNSLLKLEELAECFELRRSQ
jgi:hypothetical protein